MRSCVLGVQLATLLSVVQAQRNSQAALTARVRSKMVRRPDPPRPLETAVNTLAERAGASWARARQERPRACVIIHAAGRLCSHRVLSFFCAQDELGLAATGPIGGRRLSEAVALNLGADYVSELGSGGAWDDQRLTKSEIAADPEAAALATYFRQVRFWNHSREPGYRVECLELCTWVRDGGCACGRPLTASRR